MDKTGSEFLFNSISPVYGLFYEIQKKKFVQVIEEARDELDLSSFETILDVGCGTGALCSVLNQKGLGVTGIDPAVKMLGIAMNKPENKNVQFFQANVIDGLPFEDNSFDVSIASYVAHGMNREQRKIMYAEMSRVTREKVIIYDYNKKRGLLTTIVEWLEGGDYFNFIRNAESEMKENLSEVRVVNVDIRAAWYICAPK